MDWGTGLATYVVIWWIALFAVLPWGIKTDPETGQIGAPLAPQLMRKFVATSLLSAVIWLIIYLVVTQPHLFSFREQARQMPL